MHVVPWMVQMVPRMVHHVPTSTSMNSSVDLDACKNKLSKGNDSRPSVWKIMTDAALESCVLDLERLTSQPRFEYAPGATRERYLGDLAAARAEIDRRRA